MPNPDRDALARDRISIPVPDRTADDIAGDAARARGQFLARQDRWDILAREMRDADLARHVTPSGQSIAELLSFGARSDAVLAVEHALRDGAPDDHPALSDGIAGLETIRDDEPDDPMLDLLIAQAHTDLGWLWWRAVAERADPGSARARGQRHFDRAAELLAPHCGLTQNSPAIAAAQCALLAGHRTPGTRLADAYEDLIDLDPGNPRHMRALGVYLLPRWLGDYPQLELEARRTAARTQDIWGAGGYTWVCFDAILQDREARARVDIDFFTDGLQDIIATRPDQAMVNLLAAYCARDLPAGNDPVGRRLAGCASWLIRDHLTELHPLIWAHAADGFDNAAPVTSLKRYRARGEDCARRALAETFRAEIADGQTVSYSAGGVRLLRG